MSYGTPYQWRGKTYKTLGGLHNAALKVYPSCGLSFEHDAMVLSFKSETGPGRTYLRFTRTIEDVNFTLTSVIAAEPRT